MARLLTSHPDQPYCINIKRKLISMYPTLSNATTIRCSMPSLNPFRNIGQISGIHTINQPHVNWNGARSCLGTPDCHRGSIKTSVHPSGVDSEQCCSSFFKAFYIFWTQPGGLCGNLPIFPIAIQIVYL